MSEPPQGPFLASLAERREREAGIGDRKGREGSDGCPHAWSPSPGLWLQTQGIGWYLPVPPGTSWGMHTGPKIAEQAIEHGGEKTTQIPVKPTRGPACG